MWHFRCLITLNIVSNLQEANFFIFYLVTEALIRCRVVAYRYSLVATLKYCRKPNSVSDNAKMYRSPSANVPMERPNFRRDCPCTNFHLYVFFLYASRAIIFSKPVLYTFCVHSEVANSRRHLVVKLLSFMVRSKHFWLWRQ